MSDLYVATTTLDLPPAEGLQALASEGWRHVCVEGDATQMHQIARQRPLPAAHLVTPWLNLASDDRSRYERSLAEAREAIRILGDTGATWLAVSPGFAVYGGLDPDGKRDSEPADRLKARLRLLRALDRLANDADNHRMQLILRQQPALGREELLVDADDGDRLLQSLGAPHVALGLDLGHAKITARRRRRDPDELVEGMLANARMVWLHGNEGRDDAHARPKLDSWEMSQLDRPAIRALSLVYDAWRQPAADLRAVVSHLCDQGGRSV